jgi:3-isopropylmalate/(R)-2-methylmalate dehydratase small subunit
MNMKIVGKVWMFGDDINTDLIFPHEALRVSPEAQLKMVFSDNRPGWVDEISKGDIIAAGKNFGTGSARPGAILLKQLGLGGIVAESMNDVFFRNCIAYGFPVMLCDKVRSIVNEGDTISFDMRTGKIENLTNMNAILGIPIPEGMIETIAMGGIQGFLVKKGLLRAEEVN